MLLSGVETRAAAFITTLRPLNPYQRRQVNTASVSSTDGNMASKEGETSSGDDTPWDSKTSEKFESKRPGEYFDPCQEMASRSLKCLHRNGGNREMCADYFQAYRDCKQQWITERKEAKRKAGKSWFE